MAQIKTDPEEFLRFDKILRSSIPDHEPFYIKLKKGGKDPWTPKGQKEYPWKEHRLTTDEAVEALKAGYNIGIAGTDTDPLVIIDIDDPDKFTDHDFGKTLVARSGGRIGTHAFYLTYDTKAKINTSIDQEGEIRTNWQYVVAPGSYAQLTGKADVYGRIIKTYEERLAEIPQEDRVNAGRYELLNDNPLKEIEYQDYPERFKTVYEARLKEDEAKELLKAERANKDYHQEGGKSGFYELELSDVLRHVPDRNRFPSLFHDSSTGKNSSISSDGALHHCWRDNVSHNGIQTMAVLSGMYSCVDAGVGHKASGAGYSKVDLQDGETVYKLWMYAKDKGYLPKDDPIPAIAVKWYALDKRYCKESKVKDGWRVDGHAYIQVLKDHGLFQEKQDRITNTQKDDPNKLCSKCRFHRSGINDKGHEWARCALIDEWLNPYSLHTCNEWEAKLETGKAQSNTTRSPNGLYFDEKNKFIPKILGDMILHEKHVLTFADTREIAVYKEGVYVVAGGEDTLRISILQKLEHDFKRDRVNEVLEYIRLNTLTPRADINPEGLLINVKNGMYDVLNDVLLPHDPEYKSTMRLDVVHNPGAQCVEVDKFLHEVVKAEDVPVLVQYAGYCCIPDINQQKALLLDGGMLNGKSTFIELVCTMVGQENVSEQSLQALNSDRFSRAQLNNKLINMFPDLPKKKLYDNSVFKMLTSDQWIDGEEKYVRKFRFKNTIHQIYSANKIPDVEDPDELAFFRRWICITFPNSFEGKADKTLLEKLTTDVELSGFFNIAMIGLRALIENDKFCYDKTVEDIRKVYLTKSNPVQAFLDECTEYSTHDIVKKGLYETFVAWCKVNAITSTMKDNSFGRALKKLGYEDGRLTNASRDHVWLNLGYVVRPDEKNQSCPGSIQGSKKTWTDSNKAIDSDTKSYCLGSHVNSDIVVKYRDVYSSLYKGGSVCTDEPGNLDGFKQTGSKKHDNDPEKTVHDKNNLDGLPTQEENNKSIPPSQIERMQLLKPAVAIFEKLNGPLTRDNYKAFASNYVVNSNRDYDQTLTDIRKGWGISDNGDGTDNIDTGDKALPAAYGDIMHIQVIDDIAELYLPSGAKTAASKGDILSVNKAVAVALNKRNLARVI